MSPVSQVEQQSNYKGISRSRKFDEIDKTLETDDSGTDTVDKLSAVPDLFSTQVVKRKRVTTEENNDLQHEAKTELNQTATTVELDKENFNPQVNQDEIVEESSQKRKKTEDNKRKSRLRNRAKNVPKSMPVETNRCNYCREDLDEIHMYPGHPNNAEEEAVALISFAMDKDEQDIEFEREEDRRPQIKLTNFSVYDENRHLCPFDTGLVEKNVFLYISGYMKFIWEEDPLPEGGVPAKEMGPIVAWYTTGYDGGEFALIIFATQYAEYYLMEPSEAYAPFMNTVKEKIYMSKLVIEFLLDEISPAYEDLVNKIQTTVPPKNMTRFTEDTLLRHAQFICDQVLSFDDTADTDEDLLITTPCMRSLANLAGITLGKGKFIRTAQEQRHRKRINREIGKKPTWSKATTTKLVNDMFEKLFADQIAEHDEILTGPRRQRCGVCEICLQPDCGQCSNCRDMKKFGGKGTGKQACKRRRCPNMAIQEADDSDPENEEQLEDLKEEVETKVKRDFKENSSYRNHIKWEKKEDGIVDGRRKYYKSVMIGNEKIEINDYILVEPSSPTVPFHIYKVIFMWENENGTKHLHGNWFYRGDLTILGETANTRELFLSDYCDDIPLSCVTSKANVVYKKRPENWFELGNKDIDNEVQDTDDKTFFYKMRYIDENARFVDPPSDMECPKERKENIHRFCPVCYRRTSAEHLEIPKVYELVEQKSNKEVIYGVVKYRGEEYRVGNAVFLDPRASFKYNRVRKFHTEILNLTNQVDEEKYPEFYRKGSDFKPKTGMNTNIPEPFHIGYINTIYATTTSRLVVASDIYIKINKMYRPENTHRDPNLVSQTDLNMVYWSDDTCSVPFSAVAGKCYLAYSENLSESIDEWSSAGPHRFYFTEAYNVKEKEFVDPPYNVINIFKTSKGKGGKSKSKAKDIKEAKNKPVLDKPVDYPTVKKKLKTLDIFAGCGGLSEGLKQAGVAKSLWAIEYMEPIANAYRLNNPETVVFTDDCNTLLRKVMDGTRTNDKGQKLPQKGEVELMCGGPPCQGFSGLNRFNRRQYSLFKNSLVVTFLSFCDYYRPKFFLMENVQNFVCYKKSMVLKLTLRCLIQMGYQCTFGVLQAGNYGVPQSRRRMILLASAPGEILPMYPEPTHVFACTSLGVQVDDKTYLTNCIWKTSAPYRTITVKDSISDLPAIKSGSAKEVMPYLSEPQTHFQRMMRSKQDYSMLMDHICKEGSPMMEARMMYIPTAPGSDWRDLPNIVVQLSDNTYTNKLKYLHHDKKSGKSSTGALRGVCRCSTGASCDPTDKQFGTLIPWCLPHTGNRHNHWAGLYGRLEWDGYFSTTVTNPEPLGKQGRVLHPSQNRLVSVKECARSQGFPDSFRFYGGIIDKHRQIGNAVPPPLGAAIGYEIKKCIRDTTVSSDEKSAPVKSCAKTTISTNVEKDDGAVTTDASSDRIEADENEVAGTSKFK